MIVRRICEIVTAAAIVITIACTTVIDARDVDHAITSAKDRIARVIR